MNCRHLIASALLVLCTAGVPARAEDFVKGITDAVSYCPAVQGDDGCPNLCFRAHGKEVKAVILYWQGHAVAAVDGGNGRSVVFQGTKPSGASPSSGFTIPDIGGHGGTSLRSNEYVLAAHDFSGDGQPELLLGVRDRKGDGLAVFVFKQDNGAWHCVGEMATKGHDITQARVFRQTLSFKAGAVMHTWTWHDVRFDYLSSDKANDLGKLF